MQVKFIFEEGDAQILPVVDGEAKENSKDVTCIRYGADYYYSQGRIFSYFLLLVFPVGF